MLNIDNIWVNYGKRSVVQGVSACLRQGEIGCFLGPSGSGKTTILRAIAGFEQVKKGIISLEKELSSTKRHVLPEERNFGMVFQDYALFPHLTIAQNVAFGIQSQPAGKRKKRVTELLDFVELSEYATRYPHQLSGGQQQRIAFIRALAPRPRLLLLDEPFSSQDVELRAQLVSRFRSILKEETITAILVTHDQQDAFAIADMMGVLSDGMLQQWDTPYAVYHQPQNSFVARFIGRGAFIKGRALSDETIDCTFGKVHSTVKLQEHTRVTLLLRPDDVRIAQDGKHSARIVDRLFQGPSFLYTLEVTGNVRILALTTSHEVYQVGDTVSFNLDMQHCVVLPTA